MRTATRRPNKPRRVIHSIDELPAICDCAEVVARLARDGVLRGAKQGQAWRFRKSDIMDYEQRLFGEAASAIGYTEEVQYER